MIKGILSSGFLAIAFFFLSSKRPANLRAWQKIGLGSFILLALIAICFPQLTTEVAQHVGVERGTDLLVYTTALVIPLLALTVYTKFRAENIRLVTLARRVAFLEAEIEALGASKAAVNPK
jgi:hypothetical protein